MGRLIVKEGPLVVGYDPAALGKSDVAEVWFQCRCLRPGHLAKRTCASASYEKEALRCYFCEGSPDSPNRRFGGPSLGEDRCRALLDVGFRGEMVSAEVYPWRCSGTQKRVDIFLPLRRLIIEYDGPSHFRPMPVDRNRAAATGVSKLAEDRRFDAACMERGFKILRLHYKDEELFAVYALQALLTCANPTPMYTPSYYS